MALLAAPGEAPLKPCEPNSPRLVLRKAKQEDLPALASLLKAHILANIPLGIFSHLSSRPLFRILEIGLYASALLGVLYSQKLELDGWRWGMSFVAAFLLMFTRVWYRYFPIDMHNDLDING